MPYYLLEGMNLVEGQEVPPSTSPEPASGPTPSTAPEPSPVPVHDSASHTLNGSNIDNDYEKYACVGTVKTGIHKNISCSSAYELVKKDKKDPMEWCKNVDGNGMNSDKKIPGGCYLKKKDNTNTTASTASTQPTDITDIFKKINVQLSGNITPILMDQLKKINDTTSNKLYNDNDEQYIISIKKLSLIELGDPKNSDELDFMENVIINFLDIPNNKMGDIFKNYCSEDLNVNILLTLAILYNKNNTDFNNVRDNKLINLDRLLNRLGRYLPDVFQKILTGMKMCPGSENKYVVLEHIYKTMFKFNETNVNLGLMDGLTNIFRYIRDMKTIEMIVVIIAIAFVISKIFDMFRVKVEV